MSSDTELDTILDAIAKSSAQSAEANATILDNHLKASGLVIANAAALQSIRQDDLSQLTALLEVAAKNPT